MWSGSRRTLFWLLAFAAWVNPAVAAWPDRTIRIVVPFAPGGGSDVIARTLGQEMARDLGATIIIEHRRAAGPATEPRRVAARKPDEPTLLMAPFANAGTPSLYAKLPYDPHKDLA